MKEDDPVTDKRWGDLLLMMGFGSGLYWFFDGFRVYREYRVLADMPESRISSLAMGMVEIHGTTTGDKTLTSPLSHTPCFLYKVEIERWETDHGRALVTLLDGHPRSNVLYRGHHRPSPSRSPWRRV
jgi:hypothetical protein